MPPGYHIDNDEGLISVQVGSAIELGELKELASSILACDNYDHLLPLLLDLRGMRLELSRESGESFSGFIIERFANRPGSVAVVIDEEMSSKLSAGIFWLACAVGSTEVFDDYDHALRWLIRQAFAGPTRAA